MADTTDTDRFFVECPPLEDKDAVEQRLRDFIVRVLHRVSFTTR